MRTFAELRQGLARRLWRVASGYAWPESPPRPPLGTALAPGPRAGLAHHPRWPEGGHPERWEFPAWLDAGASPWIAALKRLYEMPLTFPSAVSPDAGLLLHALVRNIRPRTVVEIGTHLGVSTLWLASALEAGARLHTFDLFLPIRRSKLHPHEMLAGREEFVRGWVGQAGLDDLVHVHKGDSAFEVRRLHADLRERGGVHLAFIDGDHAPEGVRQDFLAVEPVLTTGGYVVFHDTFPEYSGCDGPRRLIDRLGEMAAGVYQLCDLCLAPVNHGLTILRRVG